MSNGSRARRSVHGNETRSSARDGAYIVTGGLGGIGMVVARWLVDSGAGRVVLNGRSEPSDEQRSSPCRAGRTRRDRCRAGRYLRTRSGRATRDGRRRDRADVAGSRARAAVIDDQIVAALSKESLERVWAPKAAGALRLHLATAGRELDWWVGFSSTSSLLGSPGQAAYACASAWLDALVAWRTASGLPATTINWGQWSDIGVGSLIDLQCSRSHRSCRRHRGPGGGACRRPRRVGVARLRLDRAPATTPPIIWRSGSVR